MVESAKRKKPPTFQHLPVNRARKLKQSWVQVQKIRSKWNAQKRKEGLLSSRQTLPADGPSENRSGSVDGNSDEPMSERMGPRPGAGKTASVDEDEEESSVNEDEAEHLKGSRNTSLRGNAISKRGGPVARGRGRGRGRGGVPSQDRQSTSKDAGEEDKVPSLRELHNQAYSRASLHNKKSNKSKNVAPVPHVTGSDRGRGTQRSRGRPDMRLRMNAMLEKIKRDIV